MLLWTNLKCKCKGNREPSEEGEESCQNKCNQKRREACFMCVSACFLQTFETESQTLLFNEFHCSCAFCLLCCYFLLFFISQLSSERTLVQMFCEITRRLFTLLLLEQLLLLNSKSHVRITKTREYNINNKVKKEILRHFSC